MNNREYANKLPDEEFVKWGRKFFGTDWDSASVVMSDKEIENASLIILSKPHETTADEDFAEIGFVPEKSYINGWVFYSGNEVNVGISKDQLEYLIKYGTTTRVLKDTMMCQIRTIADKKRKEVWG